MKVTTKINNNSNRYHLKQFKKISGNLRSKINKILNFKNKPKQVIYIYKKKCMYSNLEIGLKRESWGPRMRIFK